MKDLNREILRVYGDTPATRHLIEAQRIAEEAYEYHLVASADAMAVDHEASMLVAYAWEAVHRERGDEAKATDQRWKAEALRLQPPVNYDPDRATPVRPDMSESIRETIALLGDPGSMADLAEAQESIAAGDLTSVEEMAALLAERFNADRRTLDHLGRLVHSAPEGMYGIRAGLGGLSSAVGTRDGRVGVVTGMESGIEQNLVLHVVWIPDADPSVLVPLAVRDKAMAAVRMGNIQPEMIPAFGLLALDVDA